MTKPMTKPIVLIFLFSYILMPQNASAQYKSVFGKNSTSWSMFGQCGMEGEISDSVYTAKDTVVNGQNYKKLTAVNAVNKKARYGGLLREDTTSGKVWFNGKGIYYYDSLDHLVMDLSLSAVDTFKLYGRNGELSEYTIVDSVSYINNLKNIHFDKSMGFCGGWRNAKFQFTESIGPNAGFVYIATKEEVSGYLLCHYKDNTPLFITNLYKACTISTMGIAENYFRFPDLKLYPNPTKGNGIITFSNPNNTCINLTIFDLNGRQIFSNSSRFPYITFDINASENGIYIYKLTNEKDEIYSGKIVKQ